MECKGLFPSVWANLTIYQSNITVPLSYRKFLESYVDGLVGDFQMPCTSRHKVPLLLIPLQLPHPTRTDHSIYHVDH